MTALRTAAPPAVERRSARARLLAAADELFYNEGIRTVGIDRIIEHAGVAKASLYDCFGSKEELIRAYLQGRHERRQAQILAVLARCKTPRERLLGVFDYLSERAAQPDFRGCAFVRASGEARADSSVPAVSGEARRWTQELFVTLAKEAGARQPKRLAQQFVLLYDGVLVAVQMDQDPDAPKLARAAAAMLLDAAQ